MKTNFYITISLVIISILTSSCTVVSYKKGFKTTPVYSLDETKVTNGILETDLEMIGEISATIEYPAQSGITTEKIGNYIVDETFLSNLGAVYGDRAILQFNSLRSEVLHKATSEANCDIILAPIYTLNTTSDSSSIYDIKHTLTVKGFGAKIKGVRQIKTE